MKTMKKTNKFFTLLALVATIVCTSCSSNDNDDLNEQELSEVVMKDFVDNIQKMAVPSSLSSSDNQYAQQANAQFQVLKTLGSSYAALFVVPGNAISASAKKATKATSITTKTYTWSAEDVTVTYKITENSDRYSFVYSIVSNDLTGKFMDGYQLKDGSYAQASLYTDNQTTSTIKWWVTASTTKIELDTDNYRLVLESNTSNNSGNMKVYEGSFLAALYKWSANGTGSYTDYNSDKTFTW